jgi:hypothetical protein
VSLKTASTMESENVYGPTVAGIEENGLTAMHMDMGWKSDLTGLFAMMANGSAIDQYEMEMS